MTRPSEIVGRGVIAGVLGATVLAVWFFLVDAVRAEPLRTPSFLAGVLLGREVDVSGAVAVGLYTLIHYAAFILVGVGMAWVVRAVRVAPGIILGLLLGFLLFDLVFYAGVLVTGVDVVEALGWPSVLVGNVLAGMALTSYLHFTDGAEGVSWLQAWRDHSVVREGIVAGLIGAVVVAVLFLIFDALRGTLLFTPAALGSALMDGARGVGEVRIAVDTVVGYTVLHVSAFLIAGWIAAAFADEAERHPPIVLAFVLLFVTFEALFIGFLAILAAWLLDALTWWAVGLANVLAAVAMGAYLWREHPALRRELAAHGGELEEPAYHG